MTQTRITRTAPVTHAHWLLLGVLLVITGLFLSVRSNDAIATRAEAPGQTSDFWGTRQDLALPAPEHATQASIADQETEVPVDEERWHTIKIKSGDTLSDIFAQLDLKPQLLHTILSLGDETATLKRLHPGEIIKFKLAEQSQLMELMYDIDPTRSLRVWSGNDGYQTSLIERPIERRVVHSAGVITSSLFEAAQDAGMSDSLTMQLAGIFGWDIDFALDIRDGDRFSVIYDDLYVDGERLRHGDILAAEFINRGETFKAVRYTDPSGVTNYYTPDGDSMRKAFLRSPVDFSRISSGFSMGRFHPVLNRIRAHKGVDYASPTGTPIKATGDGKVSFAGIKGGYGKVVELQHGSRYSTLYGHMSRFGKGIRNGSTVRQGQIIGYVGMTGLATGPHLHYEFRVDGVHRNPLKVQFPDAAPIAAKYKQDFLTKTRVTLAQLESNNNGMVAANDR